MISLTLNDLMPNQSGVIVKLELDGIMKRRLIDMGVTEGAVLRRSEAKKIDIERIS